MTSCAYDSYLHAFEARRSYAFFTSLFSAAVGGDGDGEANASNFYQKWLLSLFQKRVEV